jgi:aldehyde:ferredoxin oxidoreductase
MGHLRAGKILRVNLTTGEVKTEPTELYTELFFGGKAVNTKILYDETGPETQPFDPENVLAIATGPLTGTACPGTGRIDFSTKSPETGILGSASMGGYFGPELKYAGYDNLIVTGKADKPVYLAIDNDTVEIKDGAGVWGKSTYQTQEIIKKELDNPEVQIVCIGPAGENKIVFSIVQHGLTNAASRTGLGAVMGSKNLKAIAVKGSKGIPIAEPKEFLAYAQEMQQAIMATDQHAEWSKVGVMKLIDYYYNGDFGPVKNAQSYVWDKEWQNTKFCEKFSYKRYGCFNCPVHCMEAYNVDGVGVGAMSCQPYLEITSKIGNHDIGQGVRYMLYCQKMGIENITFSSCVAWLMELRQRGIITDKDTDGIPMEWGNIDSVLKLAEKVVKKEGIGALLTDGLIPAAKKLGRGSEYYALATKKLPKYGLNQNSFRGQGLATAIAPRGDYVRTTPDYEVCSGLVGHMGEDEQTEKEYREYYDEQIEELTGTRESAKVTAYVGKAKMTAYSADHNNACDQSMVCKWLTPFFDMPLGIPVQAKFLSLGFGRDIEGQDLLDASQRCDLLVRSYNCREYVRREDDSLPERYFKEPIPSGIYKDTKFDRKEFEKMKDEYYDLRGWSKETGVPTRETLEKAKLKYVADDLEKRGVLGKKKKEIERKSVKVSIKN